MAHLGSKFATRGFVAICLVLGVFGWLSVSSPVRGQSDAEESKPRKQEAAEPKASRRVETIRREIEILKARLALKEAELQVVEARERLRRMVAEAPPSDRPKAKGEDESGPRGDEKPRETADKGPSRDRAIREELAKTVVLPFPDKTPFEDVLRFIKKTTENTSLPNGVPIYVDTKGLDDPEKTMQTLVAIRPEKQPLERSLDEIARQVGLSWRVGKGLVIFEARANDRDRDEKAGDDKDDSAERR